MARPTFVVHGHFYQPPRENPWTEAVPVEASAAPCHDWNERITAECYRPNGWARILDDHGRVEGVVNNYAHLSFDAGPTLLWWLERHAPDVYARVQHGDAEGRGAVAAPFHHVILPLANERDVRTQVRWGLADFAHRFGRPAEGLWLPETAVNDEVLAVLAEEGVGFTVLAPSQVVAVRPLSGGSWSDARGGRVDVRRPYRWCHPDGSGRGVDVVVYDGALSHEVAFGVGGLSSAALVERARQAADGHGLVCLAADGETFGHHHPYTERALAYALPVEAPRAGIAVSTVAAYLAAHPPQDEVRVQESAWSCAHGVGRWREDCGCATGGPPGTQQRWRAPLRVALDLLREAVDEVFERRGEKVLLDPWAARDAYVEVLLGATPLEVFVDRHVTGDPVEALTLLEAQRQALAMYTSCGWFFWDLAGLETVQCLRYAACAMDLLREVGEEPPVEAFLDVLARAQSNQPGEGDGRAVWARHVDPARVDARRVAAHVALVHLIQDGALAGRVGGYEVVDAGRHRDQRGPVALVTGELTLLHRRTRRRTAVAYAALGFGRLEVLGAARVVGGEEPAADLAELRGRFRAGERVTGVLRGICERLGPHEFGLEAALPAEGGQIVAGVAASLADRFGATLERLVADHHDTISSLLRAGYPLPPEIRAPAELVLTRRFLAALDRLGREWSPDAQAEVSRVATDAAADQLNLSSPAAAAAVSRLVLDAARRTVHGWPGAADAAAFLVDLNGRLGVGATVERAQDVVYAELAAGRSTARLRRLGKVLGIAVDRAGGPAVVSGSPPGA